MGVFNFQTELLQSTLLGLKHFGCLAGGNWLHVVFSNSLAVIETLSGKKSHHACFQHGFFFFFPFYVLCIPTKKTKQKNVDEQAVRTRKECSVSITQQKHKMEEIQFCSKVWEKHLEESWWVRDRESDAEGG